MIAAARRRGDCRCSPARNCRLRRQGEPPSGGGENAVPTAGGLPVFTGTPRPPGGGIFPPPWARHLRRQTAASSQNPAAGSGSAQIPRVFFNFPCLQLTFPIFHGILNYRKQKEPMPASISSLINGIRHLVFHHQRAVRSHSPETNNAPNGAYRLLV